MFNMGTFIRTINDLVNAPGGSDGKESICNVGDQGLILGLGRSPGSGNGNPVHVFLPYFSYSEESAELANCQAQQD